MPQDDRYTYAERLCKLLLDNLITNFTGTFSTMLAPGTNSIGNVGIDSGTNMIGKIAESNIVLSGSCLGSSGSKIYTTGQTIMPASNILLEFPGAVLTPGGNCLVEDISITTQKANVTPVLDVHFMSGQPTPQQVDGAAWTEMFANTNLMAGIITMPAMTSSGSGSDMSRTHTKNPINGSQPRFRFQAEPGSTSMFIGLKISSGSLISNANQPWNFRINLSGRS